MQDKLAAIRSGTLSQVLRTSIAARILSGDASREQYGSYLLNVYHYAQHSPRVIALAGARCATTHPDLAAYLFRHASEELGHETWAREDLRRLGFEERECSDARPSPGCAAMIGLEYFTATVANPVGLFGWMYVLESLGDDIAHTVARRVSQAMTGQARDAVYFLRGHGDADHDHAAEITRQIVQHVTADVDRKDVLYVAELSSRYYVQMLSECSETKVSQ